MAYTPLYIATTDITDSVARDFVTNSDARVDKWMENTDLNLQALSLSLGVQPVSIYTPVNYFIKEYCVAYFCFLLFQDCYGENDVEINDNDIYKIKLEWYSNRVNQLRPMITKEMMYQVITSLSNSQMVSSGILYRS